jgi:uncharacterized protein (DUF2252 family)
VRSLTRADIAARRGVPAPTRLERIAAGRSQREVRPLDALADLGAATDRDPIAVLRAQDERRVPGLVPIRWGRMSANAFAFYRGSAAVMATDLGVIPTSGLTAQLCGDAHLANFGVFSSPDRRLVFDLNDFDETHPGPFEWDVQRLAASAVLAARDLGIDDDRARRAGEAAALGYRLSAAQAAVMDPLDRWYQRVEFDAILEQARSAPKSARQRLAETAGKAGKKNRLGALAKLTEVVDGRRRFRERPPLIQRFEPNEFDGEFDRVVDFFLRYLDTLPADRRQLLLRYRVSDLALKVVGVGSVGTRCLMALLETGDGEPLFLQLKQAVDSVLEPFVDEEHLEHAGQRVVDGQRIMQSAPDVFLGWSWFDAPVGQQEYYVRQLWDGKASIDLSTLRAKHLIGYARLCGAVLARAHARSGDIAAIAGYVGGIDPSGVDTPEDDAFDRAIGRFALAYADVAAGDHRRVLDAIGRGEIEAVRDI